jgi:cytochrome d ubiquinol oxidase subunit II
VNYAVFSVFASLLITEVMGSALMIFFWDTARPKVLEYAVPIWEVTGTFGAFWVVTSYFAYPGLLIPAAGMFAGLLIVFLILFVARNSSIVFGEFIVKRGWLDDEKLYRAYALSTLLLGVVFLVLLSSLISGAGVDLAAGTFSLVTWALSPGSIPFVVGTLLIGLGLGPVFFSLTSLRKMVAPLTVIGVVVSVASFYLYSPALVSWWVVVPVVITVLAALLFLSRRTAAVVSNKAVFIGVLGIIIFSLQFLVYPSVIGRALPVDSVTTTGVMALAYLTISAVGASLLAVMLAAYMTVVRRGDGETPLR